jgi:hypothetical protein
MATTPATHATRIKLNPKQRAAFLEDRARIVLELGARGSGKSRITPLEWLSSPTDQRHLFAANSHDQAVEGILPEQLSLLDAANIEYTFGKQAPAAWRRRWERDGVPYPTAGPRSPNTLILETGHHIVIAGLGNRKFRRLKGYEFDRATIEEAAELDGPEALSFIFPSLRCGLGAKGCRAFKHRHQLRLKSNPPLPSQPDHWLHEWVAEHIEREKQRQIAGKPTFFRMIHSSTYDNIENVGQDYIDRLLEGLDPDSARVLVNGELLRVRNSLAYSTFSDENVRPMPYDKYRRVFVNVDFNVTPATATLMQEWNAAELGEEIELLAKGRKVLGVFAEYYEERGQWVQDTARILIEGRTADGQPHAGLHIPEEFEGLSAHMANVLGGGDATGRNRDAGNADAISKIRQFNDVMTANLGKRYQNFFDTSNPGIAHRVGVMKARFLSADGARTLFISPWCTETLKDVNQNKWKADGSDLDKGDWRRTHLMDGLGYPVVKLTPTAGRRPNAALYSHAGAGSEMPEI